MNDRHRRHAARIDQSVDQSQVDFTQCHLALWESGVHILLSIADTAVSEWSWHLSVVLFCDWNTLVGEKWNVARCCHLFICVDYHRSSEMSSSLFPTVVGCREWEEVIGKSAKKQQTDMLEKSGCELARSEGPAKSRHIVQPKADQDILS